MANSPAAKIIIVTGTSSGFGLLTSITLAKAGHVVYASMRDPVKRADLEAAAATHAVHVHICPCDVTKETEVEALVNVVISQHGRIDAVVNNAGVALGGFFEDLDTVQMRDVMEINFWGTLNVCRHIVPMMRAQGQGTIINISSIAGQTASPTLSAYSASKWALEGFSESLYYELKRFGVHVVLVEPGSYPTKIFKENARKGTRSHESKSPYYHFTRRVEEFVEHFNRHEKRDPNEVALLIARIVATKNPRLRYTPNFSSWLRIFTAKVVPPALYRFIYERVIYANTTNPV